jgi:hypothetical protein
MRPVIYRYTRCQLTAHLACLNLASWVPQLRFFSANQRKPPPLTHDKFRAGDRPLQHIVIKWMDEDDRAPSTVSGGSALIDARPVEGEEPSSG